MSTHPLAEAETEGTVFMTLNEDSAAVDAVPAQSTRRLVVHFQNEPEHWMHNWAICGNASVLFGGPLTFDRGAVTCRTCLRLLGDGAAPVHAEASQSNGMNPEPQP